MPDLEAVGYRAAVVDASRSTLATKASGNKTTGRGGFGPRRAPVRVRSTRKF